MTTTFKQTYSKVMEELKNEKHEFYLFLKRNNHLSWCKAKIRRRFVIFIRRNYTMPLYIKQKKEYELQQKKEKEEVELQQKKEEEEVELQQKKEEEETSNNDTKFKRIYKVGIKSYAYNCNPGRKQIYINSEWFYNRATEKQLEKMENDISKWEAKYSNRINRGGKADWNYQVLATLDQSARRFTYEFSNKMSRTCYRSKRTTFNTHFTISQRWWETATDEDLQKFNRKIISYI